MNNKYQRLVIFFFCFLAGALPGNGQEKLKLWYTGPAKQWEETLPLGNGRLGAMPDGGVVREKIVLNDITLWSGGHQDANNYDAHTYLPQIRELILSGKNDEAQDLINKAFVCKGPGSGHGDGANVPFGCFQVLGELSIDYEYPGLAPKEIEIKNYRRELSIDQAVASTSFLLDGVRYTREYFTSFGDDISIVKITSDKSGKINCRVQLSRPEKAITLVEGKILHMKGQLNNGTDGKGMKFSAKVKAQVKDGSVASDENSIIIKDATEVLLFISAGTDFKNPSYAKDVDQILDNASRTSYSDQKKSHISNFQNLFNRVFFTLGENDKSNLPTDIRLMKYHEDPEEDGGLPALFFQYGRYLSISSTRVGLLPPNLQGLWANQIQTPWNGDYHLDINLQMNHWPVDVSNLSELGFPLVELVRGMVANGEKTAKAYYGADGWIAHVITNVWGYTEPGEGASWGASNAGSGWICNNLWSHYEFTNDIAYLEDIYPILKGSAQFYLSALIKDPKTGWFVTSPSISPENNFYMPNGKTANISMGPTIDNQIVRDLFTNVAFASKKLNVDPEFRSILNSKIKELPPVGNIGADGRLMEWIEDYEDVDPHHRHISHLYGLYPASLITLESTPQLAEACKKTLEMRGDDGPSWSIANKMLYWARLHEGERAKKLLDDLLRPTLKTNINYGAGGGVYPNLLSAGPPFQIDGNFGGTAGIAEMLIQSHTGIIELLPAIPEQWKSSGEVKGLKARGNFTVDFKWRDGKVTDYRIMSDKKKTVKVKVNGKVEKRKSKVMI